MDESRRTVAGEVAASVPDVSAARAAKCAAADPASPGPRRFTRAEKRRRRLRKKYNRSYMRQWRANAQPKPEKKSCRRGTNPRCPQGRFLPKSQSHPERHGSPLCGICGRVQAICAVTRLEITQESPGGFRIVRVPYCGSC